MRHFALSAVGRDRPGIVAAMSEVLLRHSANIEDSQMSILRGHFAMMLVVAVPGDADAAVLRDELADAGRSLDLDAVALSPLEEVDPASEPEPSHVVTVYGIDHPGIVHAVTSALADRDVDITDLTTRVVGEDAEPIYALMMEVAAPAGEDVDALLASVADDQNVDATVRPIDDEAL
ncbi:MAG: glycine cleavage system protein R [Thermoleophilaceae bacterium]|jgi:glycine cleavage system transcriptional repressor